MLVTLLGIAVKSFDASLGARALRCLASPFPIWALPRRHAQLLLDAPLWLGDQEEFHRACAEFLRHPETDADVRCLALDYIALARDEMGAAVALKDALVLPALYWERVARHAALLGEMRDAGNALHHALRFVPASDPRRPELVARLMQANARADTVGDPDDGSSAFSGST